MMSFGEETPLKFIASTSALTKKPVGCLLS